MENPILVGKKKVVVIGASGVGLYCASLLARASLEVEVYERQMRLGWPPRTLIVTSKLGEVLGAAIQEVVVNKVKYMKLSANNKSIQVELASPDLVIEREKLILSLKRMAERSGAKIFTGHEAIEIMGNGSELNRNEKIGVSEDKRAAKEIKIKVKDTASGDVKEITADYLIGADGSFSVVRHYLMSSDNCLGRGLSKNKNNLEIKAIFQVRLQTKNSDLSTNPELSQAGDGGRKIEGALELPFENDNESSVRSDFSRDESLSEARRLAGEPALSFDPAVCQVWFDLSKTKYFIWLIPESKSLATIGLIAETMKEAKLGLNNFLGEKGFRSDCFEVIDEQAAYVPLPEPYFLFKRLSNGFPGHFSKAKKQLWPKASWKNGLRQKSDGKREKHNIFLVGDAAAQVKASTVGGVVAGLRGAKAVAEIILRREEGDKEQKELGRELYLHLLLRKFLNRFKSNDYERWINWLSQNIKAREILGRYNRDELGQIFSLFLAKTPSFFLLATKTLLRHLVRL